MINELITHLIANTSNFTSIDHAWTLEPVDNVNDKIPILYVFAGEDTAGESADDNLVAKMLTHVTHIYIVCAIADLDARKTELREAAMGWSAGTNYTDLALISGRVIGLKGGVVWWEDLYANRVKITEL